MNDSPPITVGDSTEEQAEVLAKLRAGDWVRFQLHSARGPDDQEMSGTLSVFDWDKKVLWLSYAVVRTETGALGWGVRKILEYRPGCQAWEDAEWVVQRQEGRADLTYRKSAFGEYVSADTWRHSAETMRALPGTLHPAKVVVCDE